jgi:hypothetical protein
MNRHRFSLLIAFVALCAASVIVYLCGTITTPLFMGRLIFVSERGAFLTRSLQVPVERDKSGNHYFFDLRVNVIVVIMNTPRRSSDKVWYLKSSSDRDATFSCVGYASDVNVKLAPNEFCLINPDSMLVQTSKLDTAAAESIWCRRFELDNLEANDMGAVSQFVIPRKSEDYPAQVLGAGSPGK